MRQLVVTSEHAACRKLPQANVMARQQASHCLAPAVMHATHCANMHPHILDFTWWCKAAEEW
jgi:hypothetical protein